MENYLTKFEKTRVLGQRAEQIARGAPTEVDVCGMSEPLDIAMKELKEKKIPLKIKRIYPNGEIKEISVSDLIVD